MMPTETATGTSTDFPTLAASASDDGTIVLWDLLTTEMVYRSTAGCTSAMHAHTGVALSTDTAASRFIIPIGISHLLVGQISESGDTTEETASCQIFVGRTDGSVAMLDLHSGDVLCTQQVMMDTAVVGGRYYPLFIRYTQYCQRM